MVRTLREAPSRHPSRSCYKISDIRHRENNDEQYERHRCGPRVVERNSHLIIDDDGENVCLAAAEQSRRGEASRGDREDEEREPQQNQTVARGASLVHRRRISPSMGPVLEAVRDVPTGALEMNIPARKEAVALLLTQRRLLLRFGAASIGRTLLAMASVLLIREFLFAILDRGWAFAAVTAPFVMLVGDVVLRRLPLRGALNNAAHLTAGTAFVALMYGRIGGETGAGALSMVSTESS